jgi:hypothetical protein
VTFVVQFKRIRRGVPEVIRTLLITASDGAAALAYAKSLVGTRHWPGQTDALRVMDDRGRTLLDWTVPAAIAQPRTVAAAAMRSAAATVPGRHTSDRTRP